MKMLRRMFDGIRRYLFGGGPAGRWTLFIDAGGHGYVNAIRRNGVSVQKEPLRTVKELSIEEGRVKTDLSGSGPAEAGGIVVLPAIGETGDLCGDVGNREAVIVAAEEWARDELMAAWHPGGRMRVSLGSYFKGRYTARNGDSFDESSFSIEMGGVASEALEAAASRLAERFGVDSVMVEDYGTDEQYFVFPPSGRKE